MPILFSDVSSLMISNCTFNDNHGNGISLKDFTGKIAISSTTVFRNKHEGMTAGLISGTITATNTHFIDNSANGLGILDSSFLSCNLHQLSAKGNNRDGLYLQLVSLKSNVAESSFDENAYNGFAIANGAGKIEFQNITAVFNGYSGVRIYDGKVSSNFRFSNLSNNKEDGCCISNQAGAHQFFNCTANSNLRHGISMFDPQHYNPSPSYYFQQFSLIDSTINGNIQYGVRLAPEYSNDSAVNFTVAISKSLFTRNSRGAIFLSSEKYRWNKNTTFCKRCSSSRTQTLVVHDNLFTGNQCPDKALISIESNGNHVNITKNSFTANVGLCVFLGGMSTHGPISILDNLFNENNCANKSVIEVLRMDETATFSNNIFTQNIAGTVIFLQVIHDIHPSVHREKITFNNNTLSSNIAYTSSRLSTAEDSCALVISGILNYKEILFGFNKFNNSVYRRELCVRFPAFSTRDVVNVTHNWWGTANGGNVRDRISDFDDNYDFAIADDWPFLLSDIDQILTAVEQHDFKQHGSVLSGRLFESVTLKASHSPYSVTSDLTVLDNVTLAIEAGVTVKVSPGMSILVTGALEAHGTLTEPVIFTIKEPTARHKDSQLPVRLVDGDFAWEGRAEVFHSNSWKPIPASSNIFLRNTTEVICRQLGYGPPVAAMGIPDTFDNVNRSWLVEFICHGNEAFLHECPTKHEARNYSNMLAAVVKCQGAPWGNLRFVSPSDVNLSPMQSVLDHVQFSHCGNRHGMDVAAIEAVANVPKLKSIVIRNCLSGGLKIYSPRTDVHLDKNTFFNTGEAGISFVQGRRNILVESSESSRNQRGISFEEPTAQNVPRVNHGRVFLCSEEKAVFVKNHVHLVFDIPRPKDTLISLTCQKVLTVTKGRGIKLTLLYFKGTQQLKIYDSRNTTNLIVNSSNAGLTAFVHKELHIPRDVILVQWSSDVNSEVAFLVEDMNIDDFPCTYERDFCGWQAFTNMSINGLNVTQTWKITRYSLSDYVTDYSYLSYNGKRLYVGNDFGNVGGRAAIISPSITILSQLCSVVFFYRVGKQGRAGLSLYIQTGKFPSTRHRLIWSAKNIEISSWRKVVVELPNDVDEYRLLFEGEYNETSGYFSRNYVTIDNLKLRSCSVEEHRISDSVLSDNVQQAIKYTSVDDGSSRQSSLTIERCKITGTPASNSVVPQKNAAIFLDIQDSNFTLANNFISGNILGGIQAQLGRSDGASLPRNLIYGNTFYSNANGTILIQEKKELNCNYSFVSIVNNIFESNLGYGSTIRVDDEQSEIINNFFYNNSG
ncbi:uncharacterized protein LOC144628791, partial [Oculina patagonica]